jgi:hypothetical protein
MKIDKISFGTRPQIGELQAKLGLPKYNINLTTGILEAFDKLSLNRINDTINVLIYPRFKNQKITNTDFLQLSYSNRRDKRGFSNIFNPEKIQKLSKKEVSKFIINGYEQLKNSNKRIENLGHSYFPRGTPKIISKQHEAAITELTDKYGCMEELLGL